MFPEPVPVPVFRSFLYSQRGPSVLGTPPNYRGEGLLRKNHFLQTKKKNRWRHQCTYQRTCKIYEEKIQWIRERSKLITIPAAWRTFTFRVYGIVFCSISFVCLHVPLCVRMSLSSRSIAGVPSSRVLPVFPPHHMCAFLIDGCVVTKQQKKMETSVIRKNLTWSNWRFVTKTFESKYHFFFYSLHLLPGAFSEIQSDEFRPQTVPHSWVTVPWPWSPSGLRCVLLVQ